VPVEAAVVVKAHAVIAQVGYVPIDIELVAPESGLVEEDSRYRTNDFDRANSKAPLVIIEVVDVFAGVEDERTASVVALFVEDDGGIEVSVIVAGPPLEFEAEVVYESPGVCRAVTADSDEAGDEGSDKLHFHVEVLSVLEVS
jgi:hypothetical protein